MLFIKYHDNLSYSKQQTHNGNRLQYLQNVDSHSIEPIHRNTLQRKASLPKMTSLNKCSVYFFLILSTLS